MHEMSTDGYADSVCAMPFHPCAVRLKRLRCPSGTQEADTVSNPSIRPMTAFDFRSTKCIRCQAEFNRLADGVARRAVDQVQTAFVESMGSGKFTASYLLKAIAQYKLFQMGRQQRPRTRLPDWSIKPCPQTSSSIKKEGGHATNGKPPRPMSEPNMPDSLCSNISNNSR